MDKNNDINNNNINNNNNNRGLPVKCALQLFGYGDIWSMAPPKLLSLGYHGRFTTFPHEQKLYIQFSNVAGRKTPGKIMYSHGPALRILYIFQKPHLENNIVAKKNNMPLRIGLPSGELT